MAAFIVEGGHKLHGSITPQGAKNEALQVLCAVLLTKETVVIDNLPNILDVNNLIDLLASIGVCVEKLAKGKYAFTAAELDTAYLNSSDFLKKCNKLRGSVMLIGPLLARLGEVTYAKPGGDKIGRRRLDTHFQGMVNLGATFTYDQDLLAYRFDGKHLKGCYMLLDEASVTGTANIIMASVLAEGTTTIYNAACEPYVQQLCRLLNNMGAKISGVGSNLLTIEGVKSLHGAQHKLLPDMIEVGSFIGMAAITGSELRIRNGNYSPSLEGRAGEGLGIIPDAFRRLGIRIEEEGDDLVIPAQEHYQIESFLDGSILTVADAPWPGLTPDLLSVLLVVATQAKGSVLIHQKMFESRLFFVDKLIDMGAQIILCDPHRAVVIGHDHTRQLKHNNMTSPDIRAGIAMLIAAMSADGISKIDHIDQIDRGYEDIESRLNALGACIKREE
ncbi:MAG: UDP-N-acetylglucosamine 1-carboxyvinyltransferase [Bacteroidales bacterium]|nr:UDP-N-acetylglucosamine 1-carboxyvinyltransferase [Bacteroidales bacterium]MDY6405675.1 UDP-N-acetylglucosamine 1-carboxyvinyltransferase [Bacteroidales bacterium]